MGRRFAVGIATAALACGGLALSAPAAGATTFDVTSGADDGTPGTFRWAVEQAGANPGDDIVAVAASVTAITLDDCTAGQVTIAPTNLLTVDGNGTTITQTCAGERVLGGIGDTTLNDLTLTGGDASGNGGAIELNGTLTLDGVTITGNGASGDGGGVYTVGGLIRDSVISNNEAGGNGGGVALIGGGEITIQSTTIETNDADGEGGGFDLDGDATLTDLLLHDNFAAGSGGGGLVDGLATLTDSTVSDNVALGAYGGIGAEVVSVVGSTISGNVASVTIGGVGGDTVAVVRSAVTANAAPLAGGVGALTSASVDNATVSENAGGGLNSAGSIDLSYATIAGNDGANLTAVGIVTSWASVIALGDTDCVFNGGGMASLGYNFGGDSTCAFAATGDTNGGGDPLLAGLALNGGTTENHVPVSGSPLLNKVPTSDGACSGTDQRGFARPANGACDIGAVEVRQVSALSSAISTPYQTSVVTDLVPLVTDPDGVLSEYEVQGVLHGDLDAADGGLVTYTPAAGFTGTDSYTYIVCSSGNVICTSSQTITITVGPGPAAAPVAAQPTFTG